VEDVSVQPRQAADPTQWVEEYGDYLYRYAYSRLRDGNAAEEVVQEAFLAGIRFQAQFSGQGSERGWLLAILKRKIIDYVRSRSRRDAAIVQEETNDPVLTLFDSAGNWKRGAMQWSTSPDRQIESRELWEIVRGCLGHLPQGQSDVFVLSVMENMDNDSICRELDISLSNLWVRLHRARLGLAKCVTSRWFRDEELSDCDQ
jgi:RNA polymerase sigma-70 factor (ECF subfamily)